MSQLANGTEDFAPGAAPAEAYAKIATALQKLARMSIHEQTVQFFGLVGDGQTRGIRAITVERLCTAVEISTEGDAPSGASLVVQITIQGVLQSQQFNLSAGQTYALVAVSGGGLVIPANNWATARVTTASGASDVVITLKSQLRIL